MFLGSEEIKRLILEEGLVKDYLDLDKQLQPNGFDLTVNKIEIFAEGAWIKRTEVIKPRTVELPCNGDDYWILQKGCYLLYFNEEIKLPKQIAAIHIQRSSLMRCGVFSIVGSWDTGYNGKGCSLIVVENPHGVLLWKNARVVQMHFIRVEGELFTYNGNYQKENLNFATDSPFVQIS